MSATLPTRRGYRLAVLTIIGALSLVSIALLFLAGFGYALLAPELDLVANTAATVVAGAVATLAWVRFREAGQALELFVAGAFLTLFAGGLLLVLIGLTGFGRSFGLTVAEPGQAPLYLWVIQRLVVAGFFLAGGWVGLRRPGWVPRHPRRLLLVPVGLVILAAPAIVALGSRLPMLRDPADIEALTAGPEVIDLAALSPGLIAFELGIGGALVIAAVMFDRIYRTSGRRSMAFLVVGLVIAALAQVHSLFLPTSYTGLLTSVDLFRFMFYGVVLVGVAVGATDDLRLLRTTNAELVRLRDASVQAATLAERARVARDIHDGLVQELWLARLKAGHLVDVDDLPPPATSLGLELTGALDTAIGEARQAIANLSPGTDAGHELDGRLVRLVDELRPRIEPEIELRLPVEVPAVRPDVGSELVRIAREATLNAGKHADATHITITLMSENGRLRLAVEDNGRGFTVDGPMRGYGLRSMRERADAVGGSLAIDSRPLDGTRITVMLPLEATIPARGAPPQAVAPPLPEQDPT